MLSRWLSWVVFRLIWWLFFSWVVVGLMCGVLGGGVGWWV